MHRFEQDESNASSHTLEHFPIHMATRSSQRNRTQVDRSGLISTEGTHFEATLVLSDAADTPRSLTPYSTPSPSAPGLVSLLPSTQTQNRMSSLGEDDDEQQRQPSDGEHDQSDDEQQHALGRQRRSASSTSAAAAAAGAGSAAGGGGKKKAPWTCSEDLALCSSLQQWVTKNKGMMPSAPKGKALHGWDVVAAGTPKLKASAAADKTAAAKAAYNRWGKIRTDLKVMSRQREGRGAGKQADRCDERAQSLTCFSVRVCDDEQAQLDAVVDTFKDELGGLIIAEVETSLGLDEDEKPNASQVASMQAAKDKRTAAAMRHLNVVKNGSYGFLQWEEGYTRSAHEEEAWKDA